jgi:cupin 2 domain-containing protein
MLCDNILKNLPPDSTQEVSQILLQNSIIKIERIISHGEVTSKDFWYDQAEDEFVILASGSAIIEYEDHRTVTLQTGDYLYIPSHQKHRVQYTDTSCDTIWLALFFKSEPIDEQ